MAVSDDFIEVGATLTVFAIPAIFILIAVGPFIYLWRKKKFNLRNFALTLIAIVAIEALYLYGLYWGFALLQGLAACDLYGC